MVGAAHILIIDLSKADELKTILDRYIVPEWRWRFEGALRSVQNFFKHADEDSDATFDFDPHSTELMLLIDVEMFKELTNSATDEMRVFLAYAGATWGKAAFTAYPQDALADLTAMAAQMSKREFFAGVMELIARGRAAGTIQ